MISTPITRRAAMTAGAGLALILTTGASSLDALFAPKSKLWPRWQARAQGSTETVDHSAWDRLLAAYVSPGTDGVNRVAYARVTAADRKALVMYLDSLAATQVGRLDRPEQFAFWVNLYNALTVKVVLDHRPVASIRDINISPGVFASGPWDAPLIGVEGERLTLNDIEHRILRPIWRDPRVHYAVNCASIGCPNLLTTAFTAATSESLLESSARAYVNHPRGATVDGGQLIVSSIYVWFREDFGGSDAGVLAHLRRHAEPALAAALAGKTQVADHRYDWSLNAVAGAA